MIVSQQANNNIYKAASTTSLKCDVAGKHSCGHIVGPFRFWTFRDVFDTPARATQEDFSPFPPMVLATREGFGIRFPPHVLFSESRIIEPTTYSQNVFTRLPTTQKRTGLEPWCSRAPRVREDRVASQLREVSILLFYPYFLRRSTDSNKLMAYQIRITRGGKDGITPQQQLKNKTTFHRVRADLAIRNLAEEGR